MSFLYKYFDELIKLLLDLYLAKFLNSSFRKLKVLEKVKDSWNILKLFLILNSVNNPKIFYEK